MDDKDKLPLYREAAKNFFSSKLNQEKYGYKLI